MEVARGQALVLKPKKAAAMVEVYKWAKGGERVGMRSFATATEEEKQKERESC